MRPEVVELVALARMPTTAQSDLDPVRADRWEDLVGRLSAQGDVTDDEARSLVDLLPEDGSDSYGVAWALVHVVESAPGWPLAAALDRAEGPWVDVLRRRAGLICGNDPAPGPS